MEYSLSKKGDPSTHCGKIPIKSRILPTLESCTIFVHKLLNFDFVKNSDTYARKFKCRIGVEMFILGMKI